MFYRAVHKTDVCDSVCYHWRIWTTKRHEYELLFLRDTCPPTGNWVWCVEFARHNAPPSE